MAVVGQQLTVPESGWRRYDDIDSRLVYTGTFSTESNAGNYRGSSRYFFPTAGTGINFKFMGSKIRLMGIRFTSWNVNVSVTIDGVPYNYSQSGATMYQTLLFEKTDLTQGVHEVKIETGGSQYYGIDSIDIDSTGYLLHPTLTQKTKLEELEIGDCIPCRYTALTSGVAGFFSELGTCIADEIPVTGSATPNGLFYFIKNDKGMVIADRVLQHSISWNVLNAGNFIEGKLINLGQGVLIRSLSGGVSQRDVDGYPISTNLGVGGFPINNEWDKNIMQNDLGGKTTKNNNLIWNKDYIFSSCRETPLLGTKTNDVGGTAVVTNTWRILRGFDLRDGGNFKNLSFATSDTINVNWGFRPVLEYIEPNSKQTNLWY